MTDRELKAKILAEIENRIYNIENSAISTPQREGANLALKSMWVFINSLPEEPVSEDLEEAAIMHYKDVMEYEAKTGQNPAYMTSFKTGAKWQKEKDDEEKVLTYKHGFEDCKEHINEVLLSEVLPCFMHGGEADEVVAKLDEVLNRKK